MLGVVERDAVVVVGMPVVAPLGQRAGCVPDAWRAVLARRHELGPSARGPLADVSFALPVGCHEVVGTLVPPAAAHVPEGMAAAFLPAGRYVHLVHDGRLATIAESFDRIAAWAASRRLRLGTRRLDVGYRADGVPAVHDLYVDVLG